MSDPVEVRGIAGLYDRWAETYDGDPNRTRDLAAAVLRTQVGATVRGDVLELGCGTGRNTAWLSDRARSVVAVDFSPGMIEKARGRVAGKHVSFIRHDIRSALPLCSKSADLAVIMLVLEHVEEVGPVFEECARVLRPRGHLFICELHPYRQWAGAQAQFTDASTEERIQVPAYAHGASEFVRAGLGAGMRLVHMGEWRDEVDTTEHTRPRLLSLLYEQY